MKKFLIATIFLCACGVAKSQNLTYTPFFRDSPRQNQQQHQPQQQSQRLRATAYQVDYNGNYTKIPIQVTVTTYIHPTGDTSQEVKVTSYYRSNGYGGQWENCMYGANVQQCQSIYGNEMEQSFMFKANLPMIGWIYFDL
ncbi:MULTISPECIES: hypothetical protein [Bacteroidales]|jgi:hypothetical protein|uniref:Uncharacterized protein n=2 Tax=Bacteroidales TaxID=171549 RepID=A0AAE4LK99_9BACT|nr:MULTISPECIES: hypothetical protein [Alistipes]MBS5475195.1 hypothetical protein [Alistipes sp.]MBV4325717.1 hypothetical protein [Alistipes finegoldii]MBV4350300.1 hypothetical protein [Alistipes finegoldii]MBV4370844.1 hypothetical protein [Alistipes finegoldii]MDU0259152.1 hypothetical protein [Alistipes finegoldii]